MTDVLIDIDCYGPLSVEEEMAMIWEGYSRTRDPDLRDRLVDHYYYLVAMTIDSMDGDLPASLDMDEVFRWGRLGLIEGVMRFAPCRGMDFEPFCISYIRRSILGDMASFCCGKARRHSDRLRRVLASND
ncbi:MAG: hypothetical protein JXR97_11870 [Planctomycetes bacterium]|nr:hypothetical protein [Planctomycetota bacterium]